jgi:hypothetical protein
MLILLKSLGISEEKLISKRDYFNTVQITSIQPADDEERTSSTKLYHSTQWALSNIPLESHVLC